MVREVRGCGAGSSWEVAGAAWLSGETSAGDGGVAGSEAGEAADGGPLGG